jgi:hypothetical protein
MSDIPAPQVFSQLLKVARDIWPFPNEPLDMGIECGLVWAVARGVGAGVNGYVLIPAEGHPWSAEFPDEDHWREPDVHGGVTCMQHPWLGFDTNHAWDYWPPEYDPYGQCSIYRGSWGADNMLKYWTVDKVAAEAKYLAALVAAVGLRAAKADLTIEEREL